MKQKKYEDAAWANSRQARYFDQIHPYADESTIPLIIYKSYDIYANVLSTVYCLLIIVADSYTGYGEAVAPHCNERQR